MSNQPPDDGPRLDTLPEQPTVAVRLRLPMEGIDMGPLFARHLPQVFGRLGGLGATPAGAPFGRYHQWGPDVVDVEIGVPVTGPVADLPAVADVPAGEVGASSLPGGRVAILTHRGPYDGLQAAFSALHDWIHAQGQEDGSGPWESYIDDPGSVADPAQLRTLVIWPLMDA